MSAGIVGRDAELRSLAAFADAARTSSSAALVRGEAGAGKTTLWSHAVERARADGWCVLACRPNASERQLAFAALADLLAEVVDDALPSLPAPQRRALEVALLLEDAGGDPPEARAIAAAFHSTVKALTRASTTMVAIDDAQWLDAPTESILTYAFRRLGSEPVAVLVAERTERAEERPPLGLGSAFAGDLRTIDVGPLSLAATGELLRSRLGGSFPRSLVHRIHGASGGNPFFALELGRALAGQELAPGEPLPVPTSLGALVGTRLDGLSPAAQRVLEVTAAASSPTVGTIRAVLGTDDDIGRALDEAVRAGVLVERAGQVRFAHPLIGSSVYGRVGPHERRSLHARLAAVTGDPAERAHHLALTTDEPDEHVAAAIAEAAESAAGRGAPMTAAALLEQALRLTPDDAAEQRRSQTRRLVDLCVIDGDVERAAALAERLVDEAHPEGRPAALVQLAIVRLSEGQREIVSALVDEVLADPLTDERTRAVALILSTNVDVRRLGRRVTLARGREALAIGDRLGDVDVVRDALVGVALDAAWLGEPFVDDIERAAAMGRVAGVFPVGHRSESVAQATLMWFADELDTTREPLIERYRTALESGSAEAQAEALVTLSELERRAGRLERAETYGATGLALGDVYIRATLCFTTGFARALQGRLDEAEALVAEGEAVVANAPANARILLGWLAGAIAGFRGRDDDAVERMRPLPGLAAALGAESPTPLQFHPDLIDALVETGRLEHAEELVAWLESRSAAVGHPWAVAAAHRSRGLLVAANGDPDAAIPHLQAGLTVSEGIARSRPLEHARALLALGTTLRRAKQRREARTLLSEALERFDEVGAAVWAERAAAELARIPGRTRASDELTETQRQVAELVAEGLSNKEVAARLFITVRTVEANLTKIYAKLGVRSRTELANRLRA